MHALLYVFRTKNDDNSKWDIEEYSEECCYENNGDCIYPLYDWYVVGGRFRGTIPLKEEHRDKIKDNIGSPGVFNNKPRLDNGVDYAKYNWIDINSWNSIPFSIVVDNKLVHNGIEHTDEVNKTKVKEILKEIIKKGFYDVTAIDYHF